MSYDHISIGGGVIGINSFIYLIKKILNNKLKKKINICIVDQNISNIPGGIGYGKETSLYGYFNNPLRLSPSEIQNYYLNLKNFIKLKEYIEEKGSKQDIQQFKKNIRILKSSNILKKKEIYLPRIAVAFWHEYLMARYLKKIFKLKQTINIDFFEGEVVSINKKNRVNILSTKKNFVQYSLDLKKLNENKISFNKIKLKKQTLASKSITIGLGILPPKTLTTNNFNNPNYIWDFYKDGATSNLISILKKNYLKKNVIRLGFIGSKAGFLESLSLINDYKKKLGEKLIISCFSRSFESLEPAQNINNKKITLRFFKKGRKEIDTAFKIFSEVLKEFEYQKNVKNKKYLVWTEILKKNILDHYIDSLNNKELKIYQSIYLSKLRDLTRFTFPDTVKLKNNMVKNKYIIIIKEKVNKIKLDKKFIKVYSQKHSYNFDILVNVSGPSNIYEASKNISIYSSLIKLNNNKKINFNVNKNFSLKKDKTIYIPGVIAEGFNNDRKTIIKAIINNSNISSESIYYNFLIK
tara:strand:- start:4622 stop:6190 length:1569 start_codon:yes stop_codon:yes gene_type:complete